MLITFAEYMEQALYGPEGYYSSGAAVTGRKGGLFYGSRGRLAFGMLLAEIFRDWQARLGTDPFHLVEVGAGEGTLAATLLSSPAGGSCEKFVVLGGWTQINHPTIFPPVTPAAAAFCRGCFWEYSDADTDYSQVDALEVATGVSELGPAPNPFTTTAIAMYERLLGLGYRIAAVGSSDSHQAGSAPGALDAPVGEATTVVRAPELSEDGIRCGVQADHTYVKVTGNAGPGPPLLRPALGPPRPAGHRGRPAPRPWARPSALACSTGRAATCS